MSRRDERRAAGWPTRRAWATLLAAAGLLLGGCSDDGPEGPGPLPASIGGPTMGAAIVEVTGQGITGFEGAGSSRVVHTTTTPGVHRVIVVAETPGELHFRVMVEDRSAALPTGVVLSAVDGADLPFATTTGITFSVAR